MPSSATVAEWAARCGVAVVKVTYGGQEFEVPDYSFWSDRRFVVAPLTARDRVELRYGVFDSDNEMASVAGRFTKPEKAVARARALEAMNRKEESSE